LSHNAVMRHFFVALTYGDATQPAREQGHRVMVTNHGKSAKVLTKKIPLNETITLRRS